MDLQYQFRAGSYYLYDMRDTPSPLTGERRIRLKTELVAIAFDEVTGHIHQHGSATRINTWALRARRLLRAAGRWDEANSIVVISGPLPVDEINKCLWVHGYCQRILQRLKWLPHGKLQTPTPHTKNSGTNQGHGRSHTGAHERARRTSDNAHRKAA